MIVVIHADYDLLFGLVLLCSNGIKHYSTKLNKSQEKNTKGEWDGKVLYLSAGS